MGSAEAIFIRANQIIEEMIIKILEKDLKPKPQVGDVVKFSRRKAEDGNWGAVKSLDEVYDYIRMLDADGYPMAFVQVGDFKLEFSRASRKVDAVVANVRITCEKKYE